jgi:predicted outer membrane repeat protein
MPHFPFRLIGLALVAAFGAPVQAAIFTVGSPSGPGQPCTHGTIQSAINAANSAPGADTIRLTRSLTYQPEANTINTAQELTIEGGYATCTSTADTTNTVVSGTGGVAAPVFTINAPTGALIRLRRLTISGGDVAGDGKGGGIRFEGDGTLEIHDSTISNNVAGYGGGIAASGTGPNAKLVIGANVLVSGNTAPYGGGGIYAHEIEMTMREPGSMLFNNKALGVSGSFGFGGGLYLHANHRDTTAFIGSSGVNGLGAIYGNQARYGGGAALAGYNNDMGSIQDIRLHLFSTDIARRGRIGGNSATVAGGGLYVEGDAGAFDGDIFSLAHLWNAVLDDNSAPEGAAVHLGGDGFALFGFNTTNSASRPSGALPCSPAIGDCGRITGNNTGIGGGVYTNGAILRGAADSPHIIIGETTFTTTPVLPKGGVVIHGNKGGRLIEMDSVEASINIHDALIAANEFSQQAMRISAGATFGGIRMSDTTLAGNLIAGTHVLSTGSTDVTLARSILWQPGTQLLARSGGTLVTEFVNVSDNVGLPGYAFNPRFVDPEHGDYTLRAGSPAIDLAPAIAGDDFDVLGLSRDVDMPIKVNYQGPRDIGAFERQSLQPMVLNGDFDAPDLRLWNPVLAGVATRDTTQNASGAAGSASARITRTNPASGQETRGLSQCIHLPGPAVYALNGWGRGTGTMVLAGDSAQLHWEYRRNGGENCTGAPDAFGVHHLSSTNVWSRPAEPNLIEIPETSWGSSPSITITLVAVEFGTGTSVTNAWFDGITLEARPLDDGIFANGFEP